jgi:MFS family permease
LRTAPRDALISLATPADNLGAAFGVHRTMDTIGALLGPLFTFLLLTQIGIVAGPVFVVSACFAVVGLIVLVSFVREQAGKAAVTGPPPSVKAGIGLLRELRFRRATLAAAVLGVATLSDAFVFILVQKSTGVPLGLLPLLPLGTALVFLLAATPLGVLADRIGRWPMFLLGHLVLLGVYLLLLAPSGGFPAAIAALLLHGLFYAATDGVLSAKVSALAPESLRGSALSVVQTGQALGRLASSVAFGLLLQYASFHTAVYTAIGGLAVTVLVAWRLTGSESE